MSSLIDNIKAIVAATKLTCLRAKLGTIFQTNDQLATWLEGPGVRPFFEEYAAGCLETNRAAADEEEDFNGLMSVIYSDDIIRLARYHEGAVNKQSWTVQDHAARFIAQIIKFDKANHGACNWEDDEEEIVGFQAYKVLMYLKSNWAEEVRHAEEVAAVAAVADEAEIWG